MSYKLHASEVVQADFIRSRSMEVELFVMKVSKAEKPFLCAGRGRADDIGKMQVILGCGDLSGSLKSAMCSTITDCFCSALGSKHVVGVSAL